jgi:hypothetical protein
MTYRATHVVCFCDYALIRFPDNHSCRLPSQPLRVVHPRLPNRRYRHRQISEVRKRLRETLQSNNNREALSQEEDLSDTKHGVREL